MPDKFQIDLGFGERVSAVSYPAAGSGMGATIILAHGAGTGQASRFMVEFAAQIASRGVDVVTFDFPYMEAGRRVPDRPKVLEGCYAAAIAAVRARSEAAGHALDVFFMGGKSMGGRIASQLAASHGPSTLGLSGLVFLGYPLHPPGKPAQLRAAHLEEISLPMLFVQGSRDAFGTPLEIEAATAAFRLKKEIYIVEGGDHSFKVPKGGPLSHEQVLSGVQDEIVRWIKRRMDDPRR